MNKLPVHNANDHLICLMLEPLGEDYWLKPGDSFVVDYTTIGIRDALISVTVATSYVKVWNGAGGLDQGKVFDETSGAQLDCGHQRPPDAFSDSPRHPTGSDR